MATIISLKQFPMAKSRAATKHWAAAAFLGAVTLTILFHAARPSSASGNDNTDYIQYYEPTARNLLAGNGLTTGDGMPTLRYPPGYVLLLAALFQAAALLRLPESALLFALTLLCQGLAAFFLFLIARSHWGNRPALLATGAWATYLPALWLTKQPNSELPFQVLLYAGLYLFLRAAQQEGVRRSYSLFIVGLLLGAAVLIRPIGVWLAVVLSLLLWWVTRRLAARVRASLIALLLLGTLTALVPWQTWVYVKTGKVILVSTGLVPSMRDGLSFIASTKSFREEIPVPEDVRILMGRFDARAEEMDSLSQLVTIVSEESRSLRLALAKLFVIKIARCWYATYSGRWEMALLLLQLPYIALSLWGAHRAWHSGHNARLLTLTAVAVLLYFWGMAFLVLSILRYLTPAIGLLFMLLPAISVKRLRNHG